MTDWRLWLASPWAWIFLALGVCAVEIFCPGRRALWLGLALMSTGFVLLLWPGISLVAQLGLFALLALIFIRHGARVERERQCEVHAGQDDDV